MLTAQQLNAGDVFLSAGGVKWKLIERSTSVFCGGEACWSAACVGFAARPVGYGVGVMFDHVTQLGRVTTIAPQEMIPHAG